MLFLVSIMFRTKKEIVAIVEVDFYTVARSIIVCATSI